MNEVVEQVTVNDLDTRISRCVLTVLQNMNPNLEIEREPDPSANLAMEYGFSSLTMVSLIMSIESEMDIQFNDTDLSFENFNSIQTISRMLSIKLGD